MASLMARGQDHVLKKVIEEAAEVLMASKDGGREAIVYEMADLWFHALVALGWHDISPQDSTPRTPASFWQIWPPYQRSAHPCIQLPSKVLDDIGFSC